MLNGSEMRRRSLFLPALLFICTRMVADPPNDVPVHVTVRASDGAALSGPVYVALIPADQSPRRPLRETVSVAARVDLTVPAGPYGVMAAANGYVLEIRQTVVAATGSNDVIVELKRAPMMTGTVVDPEGAPIAGACVSYAPSVYPSTMSDMSPTALQFLAPSLRTATDAEGVWHIPASRFPLIIEADGRAPAAVLDNLTDETKSVKVVLKKGAALRVALDRSDPAAVISVLTAGAQTPPIPLPQQRRVWGRAAAGRSLEWTSLPAGQYRIEANYPDPARFTRPIEVGQITLLEGETGSFRATLPPTPPVAKNVRFLVPRQTDVSELRAFARAPNELRALRYAVLEALAGRVVYVETTAAPTDVVIMTRTDLMTAPAAPLVGTAVRSLRIPKGEGRLRVVDDGMTLPSTAAVTYNTCNSDNERVTLPVAVGKDGVITLPLLVPCHALTLSFGDAGALALTTSVSAGEQKWLGEHKLSGAASAEVHVVYAGASAAAIHLRALVTREHQNIPVAEATTDDSGTAVLRGLPPGEITIEARAGNTQHAATITVSVEAGRQKVIDRLEIPEPASMALSADFAPLFRSENPSATLLGLVIERESTVRPKDSREVDLHGGNKEVTFDDLAPGKWHVTAFVKIDDVAQPVEVETVELAAGDQKRVRAIIKPLVFKGQVVSGGHGVPGSIGIGDLPGPQAVRRDIQTSSDGRFKVVLPQAGPYQAVFRRSGTSELIEIGRVYFDAASPSVEIELSDATLTVHVRSGETPVASAAVVATMRADAPEGAGVTRVVRNGTTDSNGAAIFENLQPGTWIVEARDLRSGRMAGKAAAVARSEHLDTVLELADPNVLRGVVIDERGGLAGGASVDCIFLGPAGTFGAAHGDADDGGAFSIALSEPLPTRLDCGVATSGGAIGAFVTAPGDHVELALPRGSGSVTITDWGERVIPDRFWLAAPDGRVFDLSWAAKKFGRLWSPLTIAGLPAGQWAVVRADSAAALLAIARGLARSLPTVADVRLDAGQIINVHIQDGTR